MVNTSEWAACPSLTQEIQTSSDPCLLRDRHNTIQALYTYNNVFNFIRNRVSLIWKKSWLCILPLSVTSLDHALLFKSVKTECSE